MHILIVTPAARGSKAGNRATAERWCALLVSAGHQVDILTDYQGEDADLMIALHAWRSHAAVTRFREAYPAKPLIVVMTGTDIYQFQYRDPETTYHSMALADVLIGLHRKVADDLPECFHAKLRLVLQSADPQQRPVSELSSEDFGVCVIGHLRDEKDSLRAAMASRLLPAESRIRVWQAGKPHTEQWERMATEESRHNPRFQWLREIDKKGVQQLMARSRLMVISSVMEGGANVVSEACRSGLPVIASDIPGNRGLLGDEYPGYYPVSDEQALAALLLKAERDSSFLTHLTELVEQRAGDFTPAAEQAALLQALDAARATPSAR
ncbi:selenoneine biosynthesis selenosugar synthase SenB [Marinobacter caseinilyticus]|uniref:selenoneine biosynthesis selenosugar synthase SenB n=1 Tax=Marinobacter caseinilyticus TaxID=2692195 RepID=UPI00140B643A|nr:selenoneine biosynthesis selenosugar synthase SenB [Marinobacter caseinilyticus]